MLSLITHFPGFEFRYPQEWMPSNMPGTTMPSPLVPGTYLIGEVNIASLAPGADQIVKMTWDAALVPEASVMEGGMSVTWHPCLLAEAAPHDGPAPSGATFDVRRYNDLAQRNITIEDPDTSDEDVISAVVAGTSDALGIESIIVDRSLLPADYRVFVRIADGRLMTHWVHAFDKGGIVGAEPLPGSVGVRPQPEPSDEVPEIPGDCIVTLLDPVRFAVRCGPHGTLVVHGAPRTRLEFRCDGVGVRPKLSRGRVQGQEVIFFDQSAPAIALPTRLAGGTFVPILLGIQRLPGRRGHGTLFAAQRRTDGLLSAGYTIEA